MDYSFGQLRITKRSLPRWFALGVFVVPLCLSLLMDFLHFPGMIKYSVDFMWIVILGSILLNRSLQIRKNLTPFVVFSVIWLIYVGIVYIFNFQSIFYFLWGLRNNFRFYVAFLGFAIYLDEHDIDLAHKFVDVLFWINIPITFFQFFILGYQQDYLGGIFGVERGCNAYTSILFAFVVSKSLLNYFEGKERTIVCIIKSGLSLVIAAMAELKFFFILFVIMALIAMFLTRFSWRKLVILLFAGLALSYAGTILTIVFGTHQQLSIKNIIELISSETYATGEDLGRLSAIPIIAKKILVESSERIFGMGLGNCDTSAFAICNTPFFKAHENLHYTWFSSAFLFLETGYIGLGLNLSFYVLALVLTIKRFKSGRGKKLYCQMAIIFAVICIILTFYNSALRKEVGYTAYFVLALPFIEDKSESKKEATGIFV